jgi:hypothetical protein
METVNSRPISGPAFLTTSTWAAESVYHPGTELIILPNLCKFTPG